MFNGKCTAEDLYCAIDSKTSVIWDKNILNQCAFSVVSRIEEYRRSTVSPLTIFDPKNSALLRFRKCVENTFLKRVSGLFLVFNRPNDLFSNHSREINIKGLRELELAEEDGREWSLSKKLII